MAGAGPQDRLAGCRALVTGGANGIGAAVVRRLATEGAVVTVIDLDGRAGEAIARETGAAFHPADVTDHAAVDALVADAGPFDVLVSNAGVDQHAFHTQTGPDDWRRLLDVNLEAAFAVVRAVLPSMQAGGYGRIVLVSSEAGRLGSRGAAVYAAAKGGLVAFGKSIARENARFAITCNVVLPGPVRTPLLDRAVAAGGPKILDAMRNATLLRRLGEPEEVAAAVAFLASREASFVTAEVLGVSGGMGAG